LLEQITKGRAKEYVESRDLEKSRDKYSAAVLTPINIQQEYPLLKPITFTNMMDDDYLESMTWNLK